MQSVHVSHKKCQAIDPFLNPTPLLLGQAVGVTLEPALSLTSLRRYKLSNKSKRKKREKRDILAGPCSDATLQLARLRSRDLAKGQFTYVHTAAAPTQNTAQ